MAAEEKGKQVRVGFGGILKALLTGKKDTRYSDEQLPSEEVKIIDRLIAETAKQTAQEVKESRQRLSEAEIRIHSFDGSSMSITHGNSHVSDTIERLKFRGVSPLSGRGTYRDSEVMVKAKEPTLPKQFGLPHQQKGSMKRPILLIDGVWFKQFRLDRLEMEVSNPYADAIAGMFMVDEPGVLPPPVQRWYVTLNGVRMRTAGVWSFEQRKSGRFIYRFGELSAA